MTVDRYVKTVLTIIALELFWIGIKDMATPLVAQAQPAVTQVVIRGIQLPGGSNDYLPVGVVGQPVRVDVTRPVKIEADRPIRVENIGFVPSKNPGE
jgi:hypothetical protein